MKKYRIIITALAAAAFAAVSFGHITSFAAAKAISGITITCDNDIVPGDILSEKVIDCSGDAQGDINISQNHAYCYIDDCTVTGSGSKVVSVGDKLRVKVVIFTEDETANAFSGTYSKSNVKIVGGTFISCSASKSHLTVTFSMDPIRGLLDPPEEVDWKYSARNPGTAVWTAPSGGTGYYDIWLYRGSTCIHKVENHKGLSYNFYPYMTKAGTYYFKVRTVPYTEAQKKYATKSEFAESDEIYIDSDHVSDGTGQTAPAGTGAVGWIKSGDAWFYRYPDGSLKKSGWEFIGGKWYLFDKSGIMLTGLQTIASGTYYLAGSGEMEIGWVKIGSYWNYFNPDPASPIQGAMLKNVWINEPGGKTYYIGSNGNMVTEWAKIGEYWYHFDQSGNLSRNTVISTFEVNGDGIWCRDGIPVK